MVAPHLRGQLLVRKIAELPRMTRLEKKIIDQFSTEPIQIDQISRGVKIPIEELAEFLLALELKGIVRELSGKRFVLEDEFSC